jgi:hypothetical protein
MPWFTFVARQPNSSRISAELTARLPLILARSNWPAGAAIFARLDLHNADTHYFISPTLAVIAPSLSLDYGAVECEPPQQGQRIALLVGMDGAADMLERETSSD